MPRARSVFSFTLVASIALSITLSFAAQITGCSSANSEPPEWQLVHENLPGALLRVWGRNANDVYAVGADGDGMGSLAIHFDGTRWTRLDTGTTGDLWWVHGVGEDDIRMAGEGGLILRYRPSTGQFERITAPEPVTLFGVWGRAPNDVWYVGGIPAGAKGAVWHDDGSTVATPAQTLTTTTATIFKVHGFDDGKLWVIGQAGISGSWDGTRFTQHATGTPLDLFTVHGVDFDHVFAVGGASEGVILSWDGARWVDETPPETPQLNGVFAPSASLVYAAGFNGRVFRRDAGTWSEVQDVPTFDDLHSIWIDEEGGVWAVGGRLASDPPRDGVLVHHGRKIATGF